MLPEISATDLHIAIIGQMATPYLAFGNTLKTGPLQVIRFHAFLGRHSAIYEAAEDLARHANDALVFTEIPMPNSTTPLTAFQCASGGKRKNMLDLLIGRLAFSECSNMARRCSARVVFHETCANRVGEAGRHMIRSRE